MIGRRKFRIAAMMLVFFVTIERNSGAPQYPTTERPKGLTTVKYWIKPTPKQSYREPDYYEDDPVTKKPYLPPSEMLLTLARTALDIVRGINEKRKQNGTQAQNTTAKAPLKIPPKSSNDNPRSRMDHDPHEHHDILYSDLPHDFHVHDHPPPPPPTTEAPKPMKQSRYADPWTGYYDFIITEGSFKFWSGFQLFTAGLLLYSALSAIYFAKFNPIQPDYDTTYDDYFFGRSLGDDVPDPSPSSASPDPGWISTIAGMGTQAYQRLMDTLYSSQNKYS